MHLPPDPTSTVRIDAPTGTVQVYPPSGETLIQRLRRVESETRDRVIADQLRAAEQEIADNSRAFLRDFHVPCGPDYPGDYYVNGKRWEPKPVPDYGPCLQHGVWINREFHESWNPNGVRCGACGRLLDVLCGWGSNTQYRHCRCEC